MKDVAVEPIALFPALALSLLTMLFLRATLREMTGLEASAKSIEDIQTRLKEHACLAGKGNVSG